MDYGRTSQPSSSPIDNGVISPSSPDILITNDVNKNEATPNMERDRDLRNLGNRIISSPESSEDAEAIPEDSRGAGPELGKIIDMDLPPNSVRPSNKAPKEGEVFENSANVVNADFSKIKTTGNKLSKGSIEEIIKPIKEFSKTDDAAVFYDTVRGEEGAVSANLNNSFGENSALKEAA